MLKMYDYEVSLILMPHKGMHFYAVNRHVLYTRNTEHFDSYCVRHRALVLRKSIAVLLVHELEKFDKHIPSPLRLLSVDVFKI
jgi:hypothetical protein